ncbi:hypothetical protein GSI_14932 [Ganoderma sinense ZZ0214-1]|uniref:Uncharacterized protein n=1 Tax=Ganoderma sinense ZZ0214-1 TaxID=1077348 RepID=A0A2G8RQ33_9APHY|nr:hypothetical protein GSI_14932 [Ganoderma sinense ZZ0214-1]
MYAHPRIITLDSTLFPPAPEGWKYTNLIYPSATGPDLAHYPVFLFGPYTYTALSEANDTYGMLIVAWDTQRNLVKQWSKPGARNILQITFDANTQMVTFTGQAKMVVTATLDELIVGPTVVKLTVSSGPVLPYTLSYGVPNSSQFPVIESGPYHFWPVSYAGRHNAFCVVVADHNNVIHKLIHCPGSSTIAKVVVNNEERTIKLIGKDGVAANLDYNTYFKVPLSGTEAADLEKAMPQVNCSLCCRMETGIKYAATTFIVGSFLGAVAGSLSGFLIGGRDGDAYARDAGHAAGAAIGVAMPSSPYKGDYKLSTLEQKHSLVGYATFPCGPFDNKGVREDIFNAPFPRYGELPYSGAITTPGIASAPAQAYSPAKKTIGSLPRDPRYSPLRLQNGVQVLKYIFVIVKTNETATDGKPGYQMRIHPEDFYPDAWPANQHVEHRQVTEGYRFWALVDNARMEVHAAGNLYVDVADDKLLGIDTRAGHYFRSFQGQDLAVNDATLWFLSSLGYDKSSMKDYLDIMAYFQENQVVG